MKPPGPIERYWISGPRCGVAGAACGDDGAAAAGAAGAGFGDSGLGAAGLGAATAGAAFFTSFSSPGFTGDGRCSRPRRWALPITALRLTPPSSSAIWLAVAPLAHMFFRRSMRSSVQDILNSSSASLAGDYSCRSLAPAIGASPVNDTSPQSQTAPWVRSAPGEQVLKGVNWGGLKTLYIKEVRRFF